MALGVQNPAREHENHGCQNREPKAWNRTLLIFSVLGLLTDEDVFKALS